MNLGLGLGLVIGGGAPAFLPSDIPDLGLWHHPGGIVSANSTDVDSWTDSSAAALTVSETGTNRPTKAAAVLDGWDGVKFVLGSNQRLKRSNAAAVTGNPHTIFTIMRIDAYSAGGNDVFWSNDASDFSKGTELNIVNATKKWNVGYVATGSDNVNLVSTTGGWHRFYFSSNGNASLTCRVDAVAQSFSSTVNPTGFIAPTTTPVLALGCRGPNNGVPSSFTMVEFMLYNRELSTTERAPLEAYAHTKYPSSA